ncbi:hypothetical protein Aduo_018709 [Ancylostoma duodenale]
MDEGSHVPEPPRPPPPPASRSLRSLQARLPPLSLLVDDVDSLSEVSESGRGDLDVSMPEQEDHIVTVDELGDTDEPEAVNLPATSALKEVVYFANFVTHFGVSVEMSRFLNDLCEIQAGRPLSSANDELSRLTSQMFHRYGHAKYYCGECDQSLSRGSGVCTNPACRLLGVLPKRSKTSKRSTVHLLNVGPQPEKILEGTISHLSNVHRRIHASNNLDESRSGARCEISDFDEYKADIESSSEFESGRITVVLTLSFDGVKLKKLGRSQVWPIY